MGRPAVLDGHGAGGAGLRACARLGFSCGWHIARNGQDLHSTSLRIQVRVFSWSSRLTLLADSDDQVEACRRVYARYVLWAAVRGSDLEEGPSEGLPCGANTWGDPVLARNRTRRVDFALFMVAALANDGLIHKAPAIVGCRTPSALAHAAEVR